MHPRLCTKLQVIPEYMVRRPRPPSTFSVCQHRDRQCGSGAGAAPGWVEWARAAKSYATRSVGLPLVPRCCEDPDARHAPARPYWLLATPDPFYDSALSCWRALGGASPLAIKIAGVQRSWDDQDCSSQYDALIAAASDQVYALGFCRQRRRDSGAWLQALPASVLGLRLGDDELHIAVGQRLGAPLVRSHTCCCGQPVASNGHHGTVCQKSKGRHVRHRLANDVIARAFRSAEVSTDL